MCLCVCVCVCLCTHAHMCVRHTLILYRKGYWRKKSESVLTISYVDCTSCEDIHVVFFLFCFCLFVCLLYMFLALQDCLHIMWFRLFQRFDQPLSCLPFCSLFLCLLDHTRVLLSMRQHAVNKQQLSYVCLHESERLRLILFSDIFLFDFFLKFNFLYLEEDVGALIVENGL